MNEKRIELIDVIGEILIADENLNIETLTSFIRQYPQFEKQLMEFAAANAVSENMEIPNLSDSEEQARLIRSQRLVSGIINQTINAKTNEELISFAKQAEKVGLKFPQLAAKVGLSVPILANLEQRFVSFSSIPAQIIDKLTEALQVSTQTMAAYLKMPPQMTTEASFKANTQPKMPAQKDFFTLVSQDRMLSPEQKQNLLKLKE